MNYDYRYSITLFLSTDKDSYLKLFIKKSFVGRVCDSVVLQFSCHSVPVITINDCVMNAWIPANVKYIQTNGVKYKIAGSYLAVCKENVS